MKFSERFVKEFGKIAEASERSIRQEWVEGEISSETSITDRFLESLKIGINRSELLSEEGISVKAVTLSDRGRGSQESDFGADFAVVLNIDLKNYKMKKGFFCQAKIGRSDFRILKFPRPSTVEINTQSGLDNLKIQTKRMLDVTPDSFVIIYDHELFLMVPAISINSLTSPGTLNAKKLKDFFMEFLVCFIGDSRITSNVEDWYELELQPQVLEISISDKEKEKEDKDFPPEHLDLMGVGEIKMVVQ